MCRVMLAKRHSEAVEGFMKLFSEAGYDVNLKMLNANDFDVPEIAIVSFT